jgi:hypothetical protein
MCTITGSEKMKFKNTTGKMHLVRKGSNVFIDVNPGDVVDIPEHVGKNLGFLVLREKVELKEESEAEKQPKEKESEVKKPEEWYDVLINEDGIGPKRAEDIINRFPSEELLRLHIISGEKPGFRDDIDELLIKRFG